MMRGAAFRGQPLLLLGGLLLGWLAMRVALWQPQFDELMRTAGALSPPSASALTPSSEAPGPAAPRPWGALPLPPAVERSLPWSVRLAEPLFSAASASARRSPVRTTIAHNLLLAAGLGQFDLSTALFTLTRQAGPAPGVPAAAAAPAVALEQRTSPPGSRRWSGDAWLLLRNDATTPLLSGRPSYGRSQAGGVLRYSLSSGPRRPQAYLRVSSALAGAREQELAAGFSARPLPGVPVRVAAEARVGETDRGTRARPAAYAVTELAPVDLPLGARTEVYLQAGYVGGEFATAFVDGQARVERPLAQFRALTVTAGGGAWGGAQKEAARLDIGPTAAVSFRLGEARGRVAADYRFRVAGDAEPSSGAALTVSAGF